MAPLEFSATVQIKAPPEEIFDYFADYHHVAQVLEGVSKWAPIGSRTRGVGARYTVEMVALGLPLRNVLRINRWRRPSEIGWVSESGLIKQEGGFKFGETADGVRVQLRIAYEPPGFAVGRAVAQRLDGVVRNRLQRALEAIRDQFES